MLDYFSEVVGCYPEFIEENQKFIFSNLTSRNNLKGLSKEEFTKEYAQLSSELNALHPFRDGNGRAIRLFLYQLAESAGWYVPYDKMEPEQLIEADIKAFQGDLKQLEELIINYAQDLNDLI